MSSDKPGLSLYQPRARGQGSGSLPTIVVCDSCAMDVVTGEGSLSLVGILSLPPEATLA